LENAASVEAGLAEAIRLAGAVAQQPSSERRLARSKSHRHRMLCSERNESFPVGVEHAVGSSDERVDSPLRKARKSSVEVADCPSVPDLERAAPHAHGIFRQLNLGA